ncbi:GNAT family N-acetyltransferase [Candidatus Bipolaricaulota bacterium]|nr:GNAT family N-acetyltransferase [Candidatus Bipolaricaulota bacterium]TFH07980.1 MAG: GNAT family N-acetyltransferase [Candidatus Atribacteria bacterium]
MRPEYADYMIRPATIADIDALIGLRVAMFEAMGTPTDVLSRAVDPMRDYFEQHLPTGAFRVWIAVHQARPIASIGLVIHSVPPSPRNTVGKEAYIMNLVTLPEHRHRGIAKRLLLHVLDVARSEGAPKASLHASAAGRPVYERLGFAVSDETPEMWLSLQP